MNKDQWQQIEKIFYAAMELPRDEHEAFVSQSCAGDEELLREVQALLAANQDAESFLDSPVNMPPHSGTFSPTLVMPHPTANAGAAAESGVRIGPYRLIREIGRGGMGAVWLAERDDGQFYQQVAIKLLHAGGENEEVIRRFRHERQILASLDHPNIARLLDGGTTEDGRPYFVMEYIEGLPIDEYCRQHQLSVDDRLKLFRQVCAAVHYAHQNLVIHRDLKPSNIAVTEDGTPKLLDFGIAKLIQPDLSRSYDTLSGVTPMTPAYASPEQVRGEKLTTASDVYSLGVVLYELLTGRSPYRLQAHGFGELLQAIIQQEPERPSTAITRADGTPPTNPVTIEPTEKLRRRLSGDIDSIVLMALRKEAPARYGSVEQFSEDLRRYLEGLPTVARRGTFGYRALKYVRRNKVPVAAAALILLSLLGGIGATMRQANIARAAQVRAEDALTTAEERKRQAEDARNEANQQRADAESQRTAAVEQRQIAEEQKLLADEQRLRAEQGEETKRQVLYAAQMKLAHQAWDPTNNERTYNIERMQELLDAQLPQPGQRDLRGFEWYYLWRLAHSELVTLKHEGRIESIVLTPDGTKMASQTFRGDIRIWDTATGKELTPIRDPEANAYRLAISPDGKFFAQGKTNGQIKIYAVSNGAHLSTHECGQKAITAIAFSPDGKFLAAGTVDGMVGVWAVPTWKQQSLFKASSLLLNGVVFTPDSKELISGGREGLIKVWDPLSGQELRVLPLKLAIYRMALIPGGNNIVSSNTNSGTKIWNFVTGQIVAEANVDLPQSLSCSPDGNLIASGHFDPIVRLWNAKSGALLTEIKTHGRLISSLAFTPDSKGLFTGSADKTLNFRTVEEVSDAKLIAHNTAPITHVAFTRDGRRMISGDEAQVIRIHDVDTGRELQKLAGHQPLPRAPGEDIRMLKIAISPVGGYFATAGYDRTVRTWDEKTGKPLQVFSGHTRHLWAIDISPDGRFIASGGVDTTVKIWDTVSGRELHTMRGHANNVGGAAFSPSGKMLATCSLDKVIIWDYLKGIELTSIKSTAGMQNVDFSPDGKFLAVGDDDRKIVLLDTTTWHTVKTLKGHTQTVFTLKFSPNGTRLASSGRDGSVKIWELEQGQEVLSLRGRDPRALLDLRFSPDGNSLVTVGVSGQLLVWSAATPREVLTRSKSGNQPFRATVSANAVH